MIWHKFRAKWAVAFGSRSAQKQMHATHLCASRSRCTHDNTSAGASTKLGRLERGKDKIWLTGCNMHVSAWGGVCSSAVDTTEGPRVEGRWSDHLESLYCLARPSEKLRTVNRDGPQKRCCSTHTQSFVHSLNLALLQRCLICMVNAAFTTRPARANAER